MFESWLFNYDSLSDLINFSITNAQSRNTIKPNVDIPSNYLVTMYKKMAFGFFTNRYNLDDKIKKIMPNFFEILYNTSFNITS